MITMSFFIITLAACAIGAYYIGRNRTSIKELEGVTRANRGLIEQNQKLIHLIHTMISHSNIMVDWEKYKNVAERH